jgi:hypothetical protein
MVKRASDLSPCGGGESWECPHSGSTYKFLIVDELMRKMNCCLRAIRELCLRL